MMQRRVLHLLLHAWVAWGFGSWLHRLCPRPVAPASFIRRMNTNILPDPEISFYERPPDKKIEKWRRFVEFSREKHDNRFPTHQTWLSGDIPEEHLIKMGYFNETVTLDNRRRGRVIAKSEKPKYRDDGVDFFAFDTETNTYHAAQCKNYNEDTSLTYGSGLVGFLLNSMTLQTKGYLYSTSPLSRTLRPFFEKAPDLLDFYLIDPRDFDAYLTKRGIEIEERQREKLKPTNKKISATNELLLELTPPQKDAINALLAKSDNDRRVCTMACGMGKTPVAANVLKKRRPDVIICVAPLKISVDNLYMRLPPFLDDYDVKLVDSDEGGELDSKAIQEFLRPNGKKKMIFTTMESFENKVAPLFVSKTDALSSAFLLFDEVHNAIRKNNKQLCEYIDMFPHSLLMSATIPVELYDQLSAELAYSFSISDAIRDGYVCDYQVNLPLLDPKSAEIDAVVDFNKSYDRELVQKAMYLANGMLQKGSRRCVVYLKDCKEEKLFEEVFRKVCEYQGLTPWISHIDGKVKQTERRKRLEDFQQDDYNGDYDVFVLLSVRVLDEAVDIPRCDSVFITYVGGQENLIRIVQRMMRGGRKDISNKFKMNQLFLWTDNYKNALDALSLLKSTDIDLHKRIGYVPVTYGGQERPEVQKTIMVKKVELVEFVKTKVRSMSLEQWKDLHFRAMEEYYEKYKKLPPSTLPPYDFEGHQLNLGSYVDRLKQRHRGTGGFPPLSEEEKTRLGKNDAWTVWAAENPPRQENERNAEEEWEFMFGLVKEYEKKKGKLPTRSSKDEFQGYKVKDLGGWVQTQKKRYTGTDKRLLPLSEEQKSKMREFDEWIAWEVSALLNDEEKWDLKYGLVKEYEKKEGKLPHHGNSKDEFQGYAVKDLGSWVMIQKQRYKGFSKDLLPLSEEQLRKLRELPSWTAWEEKVSKRLAQASQTPQQAVLPSALSPKQ